MHYVMVGYTFTSVDPDCLLGASQDGLLGQLVKFDLPTWFWHS